MGRRWPRNSPAAATRSCWSPAMKRARGTARALSDAHAVEVKFVACDLSTLEGCADVEDALRRFGLYADILVNNAAIMSAGFFQDQDPDTLRRMVDLNVRAVVDLTRRFLPGMVARSRAACSTSPRSRASCRCPIKPLTPRPRPSSSRLAGRSPTRPWAPMSASRRWRRGRSRPGLHAKAGAENSRYVQLFPVMTAEDVARIGYRQFMRGKKVIVAGWFNRLSVFARRFAPDFALVPFMGWLFRVRDAEGNLQLPRALTSPKAGNGRVLPTPHRRPPSACRPDREFSGNGGAGHYDPAEKCPSSLAIWELNACRL